MMKKLLALVSAFAMLLALASCGEEPAETSSAAPTTAPVSSVAPTVVPTIEPIPTPEPVEDKNLAHAEDATHVDMNTGKAEGDEGFIAYYDANTNVEYAFDGDMTTGWQTCEDFGDALTEEDVKAAADASLYYQSVLDDAQWFLKPTYKDGTMWVGTTFAEAKTVNALTIYWESGSAAQKIEDGGYALQFTADGEKWEKLKATVTRDEESRVAEKLFIDTVSFDAKEVKGIRIVMLKASTKYAPKVFEFEIYAPEEETAE